MGLHEASFELKHECPYRSITETYPSVTIREWFMNECQILEVRTDAPPTGDLREAIDDLGTVLYEAEGGDELYAVVRSCRCSLDTSLIARFERHNCLYMPPTRYRNGWERYSVTAFDDRDIRALLGDLDADREIEVLSTTPLESRRVPHTMFTTTDAMFSGLTDRQLDALRIALDGGYYQQPRGSSIEELARRTDVARSTFEEHLRKAENKVLLNAEPLVRLLAESTVDDGFELGRPSPVVS